MSTVDRGIEVRGTSFGCVDEELGGAGVLPRSRECDGSALVGVVGGWVVGSAGGWVVGVVAGGRWVGVVAGGWVGGRW